MPVKVAKINGVVHKKRVLMNVLQRSVRLLSSAIPDANNETFDGYFGLNGSVTLVQYKRRRFAICTRHQVNSKRDAPLSSDDLESLVITSVRAKNPVTGVHKMGHVPFARCHFDNEAKDEEFADLLFLEVLNSYEGIEFDEQYFFKFGPPEGLLKGMVAIGNPLANNSVSYDDRGHSMVNIFSKSFNCSEDINFTSTALYFKKYTYDEKIPDINGFSGGGVFSFRETQLNTETYLEAIILRGGQGSLYGISSEYLEKMLEELTAVSALLT